MDKLAERIQNCICLSSQHCERGQDLVEYGLLVTLIAILAVIGVSAFGRELTEAWLGIASRLPF